MENRGNKARSKAIFATTFLSAACMLLTHGFSQESGISLGSKVAQLLKDRMTLKSELFDRFEKSKSEKAARKRIESDISQLNKGLVGLVKRTQVFNQEVVKFNAKHKESKAYTAYVKQQETKYDGHDHTYLPRLRAHHADFIKRVRARSKEIDRKRSELDEDFSSLRKKMRAKEEQLHSMGGYDTRYGTVDETKLQRYLISEYAIEAAKLGAREALLQDEYLKNTGSMLKELDSEAKYKVVFIGRKPPYRSSSIPDGSIVCIFEDGVVANPIFQSVGYFGEEPPFAVTRVPTEMMMGFLEDRGRFSILELSVSAHEFLQVRQQQQELASANTPGRSTVTEKDYLDYLSRAAQTVGLVPPSVEKFLRETKKELPAPQGYIEELIKKNTADGQDLSKWSDVVSFRPSKEIQKLVHEMGGAWTVHRIEDGAGRLNLDYFPIRVSQLPVVNGNKMSAAELLKFIRTNINNFVDRKLSTFEPFKDSDAAKWTSGDPNGSVILIRITIIPGVTDLAMVVTSSESIDEWRFSTVRGGPGFHAVNNRDNPGAHPVSGNRAFGFYKKEDGWTFYTIGADRATRPMDEFWGIPGAREIGFKQAEDLWRTFQQKVCDFVNENGGEASIVSSNAVSKRYEWETVRRDKNVYDISLQPPWVRIP